MAERDSRSAAMRRRERRLRMHWRHEQLTRRMVLATVEHHSHGASRGQTTASRTRAEERETYSAPRRQEPPLAAVTTGTQFFTLDDESMPVTGERPAALIEPRNNNNIVRHVGRLLDGNVGSRPAEFVKCGDLILLISRMLRLRSLDSVRITEVTGHAVEGVVRDGGVRELDRSGNNAADEAADLGHRRVEFPVIDARRIFAGVCGRCYSDTASLF